MQWTKDKAHDWYLKQKWLVGCNFIPSTAINQLEMFQEESFDLNAIKKEISLAANLGFNSLRIYLHDLLWCDKKNLFTKLNLVLEVCASNNIKPILVLFDDCHRAYPKLGKQPKPVRGVHNSGWKQSPGLKVVHDLFDNSLSKEERSRLKSYVKGVLEFYANDERVLMWDVYNEPGQFGVGNKSIKLLELTWEWAREVNPIQPLTSCLDGSIGKDIIKLNEENSDVITFHTYEKDKLEVTIKRLKSLDRPIICTEYMAREFGTTFQFSLPIFKKYNVGCYNWGLVAGKSQTHFGWDTIIKLQDLREKGEFIEPGDEIPEPEFWFHDIFRKNGTAFNEEEVKFIKNILSST
tara:strand:+ start:28875 stop:29924 length:1050 start_codon:yes stop_codon:yes gene_type:complete